MTSNYHWETELVAVIGTGGYKISSNKANDHILRNAQAPHDRQARLQKLLDLVLSNART